MKVFHEHGSKQRLFELFYRVNKLDEGMLPKDQKMEIIDEFVGFACDYLGIDGDGMNIVISYDPNEAAEMQSFGLHRPRTGEIRVVATNRNLADVLRTLAHEIVHHKQMREGRLYHGAGADGTPEENEANAEAAVIMRKFGKANPIIFE